MRIGVDIGGMSIKIGLVNDKYEIVARKVIPTRANELSAEEIIHNMSVTIRELLAENNLKEEDCTGLGIACPGTVDVTEGVVVYSNNLVWTNVPIMAQLKKELSIPMALANDADTAALGEVMNGAAAGKNNAILITLGTGVGGGVILNRHIFNGPLRGGCEIGHTAVELDGKRCTCGRKGCWEAYVSASALMRDARQAAAEHPESLMNELAGGKIEDINGKVVFDAEKKGDPAAKEVVEYYENYLAMGIANLINVFRPEVFIIGGGVSAQKEYLTDALEKKVAEVSFGGGLCELPPIVTSELGNDAGIIGAAFLVD